MTFNQTLHLKLPFGKTLGLALALLFVVGEAVVRLPRIHYYLPIPSLGSTNVEFEVNIAELDRWIASGKSPDCIVVGSSMVKTGLDPVLLASAYTSVTGTTINCFNFGTNALPVVGADDLIKVLINKYQPSLIIYAANPRDFNGELAKWWRDNKHETSGIGTWGHYRLGNFSLEGWLFDWCYACRFYTAQRNLQNQDYAAAYHHFTVQVNWLARENGYEPALGSNPEVDLTKPPTPKQRAWFQDERMLVAPNAYQALSDIAQLNSSKTQIVYVEIPVHPGFYLAFPNGQSDYERIMADSTQAFESTQSGLFIPHDSGPQIPSNGWLDFLHMNNIGAEVFSRWLGTNYGQWKLQATNKP